MTDPAELSDAEHLFEYARQMVRCDAEMASMHDGTVAAEMAKRMGFEDQRVNLPLDNYAACDEMGKLTEMVAGLTNSQAINDHASRREEG